MNVAAVTAISRVCRSCRKLRNMQGTVCQRHALSTSAKKFKDEDDMKGLKSNPYFGKYSGKIFELQKTIPEELTRRIAAFQPKKSEQQQEQCSPVKLTSQSLPYTKKKNLEDIVNVDLFRDKSAQEITEIWLKYHVSVKDTVSVVLTSTVYSLIRQTSLNHPTFLLPLPREHGYEYFVIQSCGDEFHFTPLINFQTFKENAPECLVLTHFTEFSEEKGIVLMRGEFNDEVLSVAEAMCLTNQLHRYYGEFDSKRNKLLERFTNAPSEFRHMDLIVELERMAG